MPDQVRHDELGRNRMPMSNKGREARLHYRPGTFRVLSAGDHVRCAATGQLIPLDELRCWSVARQEAYASAELSVKARGEADSGLRSAFTEP
jgi:hypothetical protein